jgi:hypothetical protein
MIGVELPRELPVRTFDCVCVRALTHAENSI